MAKRQIILDVIITATSRSEDYIPSDTAATESVTLIIPSMEDKFVVFPKILEGATLNVIKSHQAKMSAYLNKKADEERKRREYAQVGLPYPPVSAASENGDDELDDDDTSDPDSDDDDTEQDSDDEDDTHATIDPSRAGFGRIVREVAEGMGADRVEMEYRAAGE